MAITTYDELKTAVASWLNRGDLTDNIPDFISLCEAALQDDPRIRLYTADTISVDADEYELPSNFESLKALYHDGSTYYGSVEIVSIGDLAEAKRAVAGTSAGVPSYASIIPTDPPTLRFASVPDQAYSLRIVYENQLTPLADGTQTNELLPGHPDMYLYGALVAAEPFVLEDARLQMWVQLWEAAIERFHRAQKRLEFGGQMSMMPKRAIGSDV